MSTYLSSKLRDSDDGAVCSRDGNAEAPTFSPSINIVGRCHYFIIAGMIEFCGDSRHHLAGQVVPLPDIPGWVNERSGHAIP